MGRGRGCGTETARANSVAAVTPQAAANSVLTTAERVGLIGINDAQWESLKLVLAERDKSATKLSGKIPISSWIIDTGASNHMTGSISTLENICDMPPVLIKLPNGQHTRSTRQGTVQLGSHLSLQDVYYVDGLQCHLISVS